MCAVRIKKSILVNLGQFEDVTPKTACKFKVFEVRKCKQKNKKALLAGTTRNKGLK